MTGHVASLKSYGSVFTALMALTAVTVWIAFHEFGPWNTVIALSVAVVKATLVALYFMHLRYSSRLVWVFAVAGVAWLVILIGFTLSDFLTRDDATYPFAGL